MLYENLPYNLSRMNIDRIFTEFTRGVTSERYRGINLIYNELLDEKMLYRTIRPRVLNHVDRKGIGKDVWRKNMVRNKVWRFL